MSAGQTTTLELAGGADLIIPPGAMTPGATVRATYAGRPDGAWTDLTPTSAPVRLISDPPDAIHGLLTLEFPVPAGSVPSGVDPSLAFGISSYDPATQAWTPYRSTYDAARHMIVAQIPHFSWWNPFTWDFDALWAAVAQGFGQVIGTRHGQAGCSGGPPGWVSQLAGVGNGADLAIRDCAQSQRDVLDVQIVNDRPYGQVLTYDGGVQWGWHEGGDSASARMRNALIDDSMSAHELYLPPLSSASVGIDKQAAGSVTQWHIGPTRLTLGADLAFYLIGKAAEAAVPMGSCVSAGLDAPLTDLSPSGLRDDAVAVTGCIQESFMAAVAKGAVDAVAVDKLGSLLGELHGAGLVAAGIRIAGATWHVSDLVADWYVGKGSTLGNGFSVLAHAAAATPPTTQAPPPALSAPQPPLTTHAPPATQAPTSAPPATASSPPATIGVHIEDDYYGGTWARTDPNDGTWHTRGDPPSNGAYWYPNGLGVAVDCARSAAPYTVRYGDGHHQTWTWWLHVTDNKWYPAAATAEIYHDGNPGVRTC